MNKLVQAALLLSASTLSWQASATEKHWSVGIGSYAFVLSNDNSSFDDREFSGLNLAAAYAVNHHFQIRATYFTLEEDDDYYYYDRSQIKSKGYDVMAYGGTGFARKGFRGYGGGGIFKDKRSYGRGSSSFSGIQFGGGLGYNWGPVALDFVMTLREAGEYEDSFSGYGSFFAMSGNLTVSYLF